MFSWTIQVRVMTKTGRGSEAADCPLLTYGRETMCLGM